MVFKVFFVISDVYAVHLRLLFIPTTLASLPPVMFRMHNTMRCATDIKKTHIKKVCRVRVA